jgi:hypothetical protein
VQQQEDSRCLCAWQKQKDAAGHVGYRPENMNLCGSTKDKRVPDWKVPAALPPLAHEPADRLIVIGHIGEIEGLVKEQKWRRENESEK